MVDKRLTSMLIVTVVVILAGSSALPGVLAARQHSSAEQPPSVPARPLVDAEDLCSGCITTTRVALLGQDAGDGLLTHEIDVVVLDDQNRYWVLLRDGVRLFDSHGAIVGRVGQWGEATGDFRDATTAFVDTDGRVHIFDAGNLRETIFSAHLEVLLARSTPGAVIRALPLGADSYYVANMIVRTPAHIGIPMYVVDGTRSSIVAAFAEPHSAEGMTPVMTFVRLATDGQGRIYTARDRNAIDVWSSSGRRLDHLSRAGAPAGAASGAPVGHELPHPPSEILMAMHVDSGQRLWLSTWVPREDWRDHVIVRDDGSLWRSNPEAVFKNVIEVIELDGSQVVERTELDHGLVAGFVNDTLVHGPAYQRGGQYQLSVAILGRTSAGPVTFKRR